MKKITFLALHLGYGGVENTIISLANLLSTKYEVEIVSVYQLYSEPAYDIKDNIKIEYLIHDLKPNKKEIKFYKNNKNYSMYIKELIKSGKTSYLERRKVIEFLKGLDTDILITTRKMHNKLVCKYASGNYKKIAWEHTHHNNNKRYIKTLVESWNCMDNVVLVSNELNEFYKEYIGNKGICIPNCIDNFSKKVSKLDSNNLISVGRLSKEKGFDDLLKLFKKISSKYPNWKLNIIGDGMEKNNLLELSRELKLSDKVIFHGYQSKEYINNLLEDSSIYVMTSLTESFGLGLIEAMNFGIPCISYDSAQGANEIISDGIDGYLIKDRNEDEMIEKISYLIDNQNERKKMGKKAKEKAKDYSGEVILEKWIKLIEKRGN